jgi:signal transduction histidine kinase
VEQHDGQVWVEGNRPTGSRFVVRLPAARSGQIAPPQTNLASNI